MSLRLLLPLCLFLLATTIVGADESGGMPPAAVPIHVRQTDAELHLVRNESVVLAYRILPPELPPGMNPVYARTGFLHPLRTPAGRVVSGLYPADHPHQDGVFTAWVRTTWRGRPVDFWNLAGGTGRVQHQRVLRVLDDGQPDAGFEVQLVHRAVQEPATDVLQEHWQVRCVPTDGSWHAFDLTLKQTALTDEPLLVHAHRYGGVALRGTAEWLMSAKDNPPKSAEADCVLLTDQGLDRISGNHQPARWVAMSGPIDGAMATVCVLSHPTNQRAPQTVRLHPTKPYFCFAPCVAGEFVIDRDHPYHARYRYLLTDAVPDPDWIERQWQAWSGTAP